MAKLLFEWDYSSYPGAKKSPNLFKPIQIGNLIIPNRIKYAATEDNLNSHDGFVSDADVAYIRSRAEGGGRLYGPFGHGPSNVPQRLRIFRPMHEMSVEEIQEMVRQHGDAARRGVEAGFDVIEISGIVGYLICT